MEKIIVYIGDLEHKMVQDLESFMSSDLHYNFSSALKSPSLLSL